MQMDLVSLHAKRCIDTLKLDLVQLKNDSPRLDDAAHRLLLWDGRCHEKSVEATLFHVFYRRLMANLFIPALGQELFEAYGEIFNQCLTPTDQILSDPNSPWFSAQSRSELVAKSLQETCEELTQAFGDNMANWKWGRIHTLILSHSLGRIKLLRPMLATGLAGGYRTPSRSPLHMPRPLIVFHAAALWLISLALPIALAAGERTIVVGGARSLGHLAEKYSAEFRKTHPSVEIELRPANSN